MRSGAHWIRLLPWMAVYAIAMAFLESAVVVYLRELYYPTAFRFPVVPIAPHVAITEFFRELATMVMLLAPAALVSARRMERFAWFSFCFGVWDIFYYVFLKALLGWPVSLFDWDILFLVPVVWVGPVLAPCLISVGLIVLGCSLLSRRQGDPTYRPRPLQWVGLSSAGGIFLYTFIEEPMRYALAAQHAGGTSLMAGHLALDRLRDYVPAQYDWGFFAAGCGIAGLAWFGRAVRR